MSEFYKRAREFSEKNILPYAKEIDEKKVFPEETFKQMGKEGYFKLLIPQEYGGQGKTLAEHADVCRGFAETCATAGLCYMMHNVASMCVLAFGSEELKTRIFKDVVENEKFLALAYSEFGTGTHFYIPEIKAQYNGDEVTFNGSKSMVTSATYASYYLVLAPSQKEGAIDNWVFPLETQGVEFLMDGWNGMGMRGNVSCPMKFTNAKLKTEWRIGEEGSGLDQVFQVVAPFFVTGLAAVYTGVSSNILAEATKHAKERVYPSGQALCKIETVQIHLSNIYARTNASILGVNEAARAGVAGDEDALAKILSARIFASESAIENARLGMRIGGGKAYNKQGVMERLLRDSYAGQIMAPSVDVLHTWLGKAITGQDLV